MTRSDYVTKVQNEVDDTSTASANVIKEALVEAYAELMAEMNAYITGDTSEEVAVTSATVTPTYAWEQIRSVYYKGSTWEELERISEEEYGQHLNDTDATPKYYVIRGNTIVLNGTPTTGTLRIQGLKEFSQLTSDSDTVLIPDRFSRVLVLGACYRFFGYEKGSEAENYKNWYEQAKAQMLSQLTGKHPTINPTLY